MGEERREGGVGEASVFLVNKMKRKWLFYTQVRSSGRVLPVRVCAHLCVCVHVYEMGKERLIGVWWRITCIEL